MRNLLKCTIVVMLILCAWYVVGHADGPKAQYQLELFDISGDPKGGVVNAHITANVRNTGYKEGAFFHVWFKVYDGDIYMDSRQWEHYLPAGTMQFWLAAGELATIAWTPQVRLALANNKCDGDFRVNLSIWVDKNDYFETGWMERYCESGAVRGWRPAKEE